MLGSSNKNEVGRSWLRPDTIAIGVPVVLVLSGVLAWATTFTTHLMNANWAIPWLIVAVVAAPAVLVGYKRWWETSQYDAYGYPRQRQSEEPAKVPWQRTGLGIVIFTISLLATLATVAVFMLGNYFSNVVWRSDVTRFADDAFEVEARAPYQQAQQLLSKRAGNLSGKMSLATYVANHPHGPRWTAIVDGNGAFQPMVGVVEWDPSTGQVRDCRMAADSDSLGGTLWNSLVREIHKAPGGRGHLVVTEDAWGYCNDGEPVIVAPLVQEAGTMFLATVPSGVAVIDAQGRVTIDTEVTPGEYPGPVVGTAVARDMWESNRALDGFATYWRKTGTYVGSGQTGYVDDDSGADDINVAGGNSSEFLTRTDEGRLVYVTPMSVYGSSQSVTAVAMTYADEIRGGGVLPETVIYRFDEALPSPGDADQVIRAEFGDLPWAAGLSVMEVTPVANGRMVATLGQTTVATWKAEIIADKSGGDPKVCITSVERGITRCSTDDVETVESVGAPTVTTYESLEELTDEELANLISEAANELARRANDD